MDFTLKDLVYIAIYVATVTALIVKFRYRISKAEDAVRHLNRIVFLERGGLNVITQAECLRRRTDIIDHTQEALKQIQCLNQNIVKIMLKLHLEPVQLETKITTAP